MLSVATLKDQIPRLIKHYMTPRRRRLGVIFLAIFIAYSVLGVLAAPGFVISQTQKFVQEKLKLELSMTTLELNPWLLAVRIDGLRIKEPGAKGETLVAVKSLYVNAQLWSSIWVRGASLAEVDLIDPYINARIRRDGRINLLQLIPPDDDKEKSATHWRVGLLGVHRGRIDFNDDTRRTPFSALFSPLSLSLSDLSSNPDKDGGYTLHAETGDGETLDWHGTVSMQPLRSQGELKISTLQATTPWRYMQDALPLIVDQGLISISGHYQFNAGDADKGVVPSFSLEKGRVVVDDLSLHQRAENPLGVKLKQLDLNGVTVQWPAQTASFTELALQGFHLTDKQSDRDLSAFDRLQLQSGRYLSAPQCFELASINLQQLTLMDSEETTPLLTLPGISLNRLDVSLDEQRAHIDHIILEQGDLSVRREKNGALNWETRLNALNQRIQKFSQPLPPNSITTAPAKQVTSKKASPETKKAWVATLGELDLKGFRLGIEDQVPHQVVKNSLEDINLRIFPQQSPQQPHVLEGHLTVASGGSLGFKGKFNEQPLSVSADLDLQKLQLPVFAPYFENMANFALKSGELDVGGSFNFSQNKTASASFNGQVAVHRFSANDLQQDERFLAWNTLAVNGLNWQLAPGKISIRDIEAEKPFIRVIIGPDKSLNLSHIVVAAPEKTADAPVANAATEKSSTAKTSKTEPPYPLRIDRIRLKDGSMLFADFTLKPQFATGIQSLNGDIHGISTVPGTQAIVALSGRVDQYGKADITGSINPLASDIYTDIGVRFSNLELTTLTPYSAKFAGYRIDKGKLSLDLNYKIEQRKLNATNKVVFNQLTLGEKVDSPDSVGLPLKLAVAILKDKNGIIDIDLPLTGSIDDPKFKVGPLIWKALLNLLTKAATAPFSIISGLVGGGDNLDSLSFSTGQSTLTQDDSTKLDKLAKALSERPALGVEIRGAYDPQADALAIKTAKFNAVYDSRVADGEKPQKILESLFTASIGKEALVQQQALYMRPVPGGHKNELELAPDLYINGMRNELIAREVVLEGDLRQLAFERANVARRQLVDVNKINAARVFVLDPVMLAAIEHKVVMKIALSAN